ncbi:hypothetical protein D3H35_27795 [Cohnella faecalis]|uniref:Cellulose biosynthesis cyclic di-GMP-binding regulatory protein BcsB n=2 Tax=Cohnella faecalis TaxID=2315694 RepID=A0A398CBL2_9BACL|nr:hypothetical protein D3H35_27795 [Cohnella faecalis]
MAGQREIRDGSVRPVEGCGPAGKRIVGETPSPWNAKNTMMLVSGTGKQLANAATILTTDTLYAQLRGSYSVIPEVLTGNVASSDSNAASDNSKALTLEQLGYGNLVTAEVLQGASSINYPIPNNWDLTNGALLHLSYKHSKSISYDKSVMTVKLNGVPVQSVKLGKATSDGGTLDVPLDPTVIGTNRTLSVEIGFQFVNGSDNTASAAASSFCSDTLLGNWAVVDKSSYLTFTPSDRLTYNLDSLPYPFVAGDEWNSTTILMNNRGSEELSSAISLINRMDTVITDRSDFQLADIASGQLQDKLKDRNVIFVGSSKELPDFLNGYDNSYVIFSPDAVQSISDKAEILAELTKKSTILQLTSSPLNPDRSVLLLVAPDRNRLLSMGKIWTDVEKSNQIRGRLVVIDEREQVYSFNDTIDARKPSAR